VKLFLKHTVFFFSLALTIQLRLDGGSTVNKRKKNLNVESRGLFRENIAESPGG
jgi:hypothetical protein